MPTTELVRALTRIEVKLDRAISDYEKHETRIAALEKRVWALPSAATVIALVGLVVALLKD